MNVILLCGSEEKEMDCTNVGAVLIGLDNGKTVALTGDSLRNVDLEKLDARQNLSGWMQSRLQEFERESAKEVA